MKYLLALCAVAFVAADPQTWSVQDANGNTCIILQSAPLVTVTFNTTEGPLAHTVAVNGSVDVTGSCNTTLKGVAAQKISLDFWPNGVEPETATSAHKWGLDIYFGQNGTGFSIIDYDVRTSYYQSFNGSGTFTFGSNFTSDVTAGDNSAYKCSSVQLPLANSSNIDLQELKVIAYANLKAKSFPDSQVFELCRLDTGTSDIVPIIVGACLAGLVVIVLVAYLIGRARARRQGYASV